MQAGTRTGLNLSPWHHRLGLCSSRAPASPPRHIRETNPKAKSLRDAPQGPSGCREHKEGGNLGKLCCPRAQGSSLSKAQQPPKSTGVQGGWQCCPEPWQLVAGRGTGVTRAQPQQVGTMHAAPAHLHRALLPGQFSSHLPRGVNSLSISASELQLPVLAPGSGAGEDPAASPAAPTVSGCV